MCGRYSLTSPPELLATLFGLARAPSLSPRYNIAPTQAAPVVRVRTGAAEKKTRGMELLRWGLIPQWADDPAIGNRMINARAETINEKPAYRQAFRDRRCLVPADGFYEWQVLGKGKQPHFIHRADNQPMAIAGLWERCEKAGPEPIESFTILTTSPNDLMRELHDRMPVIIEPEDFDRWMDPSVEDLDTLVRLLRPCAAGVLAAFPVGAYINNPRNEGPQCVEPVVAG
jgi:putative SOS response-associated peptidase YedK